MEEQNTQTATMEAPETTTNSPAPVETAVKLQSGNNSGKVSFEASEPESGKAEKAPEQAIDKAQKTEKKADKTEAQPVQPVFEPLEMKWLKSKGIDTNGLTGANMEAVKTLVKNARSAESEAAKIVSSQKAKEIAEAAKTVKSPDTQKPARKTKIEEYEAVHNVIVDNIAHYLGVNPQDIATTYPEIAHRMNQIYVTERQKAWEAEQAEMRRLEQQEHTENQNRERFTNELKQSEEIMRTNLLRIREQDKDVDSNLEVSGVNSILESIEKDAAWPVSFVMSNPKMAEWFTKAAKAIVTLENLPQLQEEWKSDYEKQLKKINEAKLTPAGGGEPSAVMNLASRIQKPKHVSF